MLGTVTDAPSFLTCMRWAGYVWLALVGLALLLIIAASVIRNTAAAKRRRTPVVFIETTTMPDVHGYGDDGVHPGCIVHDLPAAHRLCPKNPERVA